MKKLLLAAGLGVAAFGLATGSAKAAPDVTGEINATLAVTDTLSMTCGSTIDIGSIAGVGTATSADTEVCTITTNQTAGYELVLTQTAPLTKTGSTETFSYNKTCTASSAAPCWFLNSSSAGGSAAPIDVNDTIYTKASPSAAEGDKISTTATAFNTASATNPDGTYTGTVIVTASAPPATP